MSKYWEFARESWFGAGGGAIRGSGHRPLLLAVTGQTAPGQPIHGPAPGGPCRVIAVALDGAAAT